MEYIADKTIIESREYAEKFKGVTLTDKGDKAAAYYARQSVLNNDGLSTEDVYFLNAKNGKLIFHKKLGELGGVVTELSKLNKTELIVLIHNHPNSRAFSFKDFVTLNNFPEFKTMIAAGHDGSVYFLSVGNGVRLDLTDMKNFNFFDKYWARQYKNHNGEYGALKEITKELGWTFYVK